ncbi:hypothetical protein FIBSPDRAFT_1022056 [Athelia psychrophila]|uniref:Uncharacterized protein n=1 Tax=Athelia psychrophila TaxID=1759441 RepID=A0A166J9E1_9AGAM|nr:hypothetical protein FIBSPDRAFT_1022056 [Fibularhizoctonia sp. CBS 109695]
MYLGYTLTIYQFKPHSSEAPSPTLAAVRVCVTSHTMPTMATDELLCHPRAERVALLCVIIRFQVAFTTHVLLDLPRPSSSEWDDAGDGAICEEGGLDFKCRWYNREAGDARVTEYKTKLERRLDVYEGILSKQEHVAEKLKRVYIVLVLWNRAKYLCSAGGRVGLLILVDAEGEGRQIADGAETLQSLQQIWYDKRNMGWQGKEEEKQGGQRRWLDVWKECSPLNCTTYNIRIRAAPHRKVEYPAAYNEEGTGSPQMPVKSGRERQPEMTLNRVLWPVSRQWPTWRSRKDTNGKLKKKMF